jgi:hypothetical protein
MTREENDKKFMNDPEHWPQWPFLPVKNRDRKKGVDGTGIMISLLILHKPLPTVYHANLFAIPEGGLSSVPKTEYRDLDELLAAGWVVD